MQRAYPLGLDAVSVKLQNAPVAKQSSIFQAISCDMGGGDGLWLCTEWKGTVAFVVSRTEPDSGAVRLPVAG